MNNIDKKILREKYLLIRNNIKNKRAKSEIIMNKIIETDDFKNAKIIALYKSLKTEVYTNELIGYSIKKGKTVVLPKVENNNMKFYKINSMQDKLIKSRFGVEEPITDENNFINKEQIDLVIVPGVCFDKEKNRLGFGKGYYDKFLKNTKLNTIAICFDEQILDTEIIPITTFDVKMKKIITENGVY